MNAALISQKMTEHADDRALSSPGRFNTVITMRRGQVGRLWRHDTMQASARPIARCGGHARPRSRQKALRNEAIRWRLTSHAERGSLVGRRLEEGRRGSRDQSQLSCRTPPQAESPESARDAAAQLCAAATRLASSSRACQTGFNMRCVTWRNNSEGRAGLLSAREEVAAPVDSSTVALHLASRRSSSKGTSPAFLQSAS